MLTIQPNISFQFSDTTALVYYCIRFNTIEIAMAGYNFTVVLVFDCIKFNITEIVMAGNIFFTRVTIQFLLYQFNCINSMNLIDIR